METPSTSDSHSLSASSSSAQLDEKTALPNLPPGLIEAAEPVFPGREDVSSFKADEKGSQSVTQTVSLSKVEKSDTETVESTAWSGYEDEQLPDKRQGRMLRNLRHQIFSVYRRLFGLVFVVNMAIFIALLAKGSGHVTPPKVAEIVVANIFITILMRQDYVINGLFTVFCAVPRSWPLIVRITAARIYNLGGIHSGAGVSSAVWLILFTGQATRDLVLKKEITAATLGVAYAILALLLVIIVLAFPQFRAKFHDTYERTHRLLGWSAIVLLWALVVLLTKDYKAPDETLGHALAHASTFWLTLIMSLSIVSPWTKLRHHDVQTEVLSSHALRIYLPNLQPGPGSFMRVSDERHPVLEWHSFATIAEPGKKGYSLIVSQAGDWTTRIINNPPTKLWVRGDPVYGVLRIVPMFRRVVCIATGSGIAPFAPHLLAKRTNLHLLWTAPNVRKTFGDKLVDQVLEAQPGAVIYDTRTHGKPNMVKLANWMVERYNPEIVCIISNPSLTYKVVYGMRSRGIRAFGAIWDS